MHKDRKEARARYVDAVRRVLIGPLFGEEEELRLSPGAVPRDVYSSGVLYPIIVKTNQHSIEQTPDEEDPEWGEGEDEEEVEVGVSQINTHHPSTMGISFAVQIEGERPTLDVCLMGGRYKLGEDAPEADEEARGEASIWKRHPLSIRQTLAIEQGSTEIDGGDALGWYQRVVRHPGEQDLWQVTLILINSARTVPSEFIELMELSIFQARLTVRAGEGCRIVPRRARGRSRSKARQLEQLLYRGVEDWAAGHTCSVDWKCGVDGEVELETTWMPTQVVPGMNPMGSPLFGEVCAQRFGDATICLSADELGHASKERLVALLAVIPEVYTQWLDEESRRSDDLEDQQLELAGAHLDAAREVSRRIREGISTISTNPRALEAFQLSQRAISIQYRWRAGDSNQRMCWRPFQLAFQLLCLTGLLDGPDGDRPDHPERDIMDLLWFPTGGGKTEAYLALTAMTIFARRLRSQDEGAGTTVLMRYTLRLLTMQQFERASRLILACEKLRREQPDKLGGIPIDIGLWVGSSTTPNKISDAREGDARGVRQLARCPACGDEKSLRWDVKPETPDFIVACENTNCEMAGELPIYTIDEMVYRKRPSLVIGTVDKFAQIVRNAQTGALFGSLGELPPPELIIQDELHLISGPLGSIVGLYEAAIDMLCEDHKQGRRPKVIGSTATIQNADEQVRALFDRELCQFPPPVLDAADSCLAQVDLDAPGRLYMGISSAGRSPKYAFQRSIGALLYHASPQTETLTADECDPYWTVVAYFNTLRELGGALVMMYDDVQATMDSIAQLLEKPVRSEMSHLELSSRVDAADIPQYVLELERPYPEQTISVALATNMISVGVDIPRLGAMVINGQPKSMAEYIQASARVGRGALAGVVLTVLNHRRARDRAHFESFRPWHQKLYASVEPVSVTPFSPRARDRALHAVIVALARHLLPRLDARAVDLCEKPTLGEEHMERLEHLIEALARRAASASGEEAVFAHVLEEAHAFLESWRSVDTKSYWNDFKPGESLLVSAEEFAQDALSFGPLGANIPRPTLNSMRNVEPSCSFQLKDAEAKSRSSALNIKI